MKRMPALLTVAVMLLMTAAANAAAAAAAPAPAPAPAGAHATAPTAASIDKLLSAMHIERTLDAVLASVEPMMRTSVNESVKGGNLSAEQKQALENMVTTLTKSMHDELKQLINRDLYAKIYAETYTQAEVDGQLAFYTSPVGASVLAKMPLLMQRSTAEMQGRLGPMIDRMQAAVRNSVEAAKPAK